MKDEVVININDNKKDYNKWHQNPFKLSIVFTLASVLGLCTMFIIIMNTDIYKDLQAKDIEHATQYYKLEDELKYNNNNNIIQNKINTLIANYNNKNLKPNGEINKYYNHKKVLQRYSRKDIEDIKELNININN